MIELLNRYLRPLQIRIAMMIARAVVAGVKDGGGLQTLQLNLLADETQDNVSRVQNYGFTSNPKLGAEAVTLFLNGARDNGIVIAVDDRRYRLKSLQSGEVAIYTDEGDKIHLKRNNTIEVLTHNLNITATVKVQMTTPELNVSGNIIAGGNVTDSVRSMAGDRTIYNGHTHPENNAPGSHTNAPDQPM